MEITLPQVYRIDAPATYKVHLASWNGWDQPLDVFVRDRNEWDGWNSWGNKIDVFNRDNILALIDFYPERDRWLFGGAYQVRSRSGKVGKGAYKLRLIEACKPYIGRLKIEFKRPSRAKAVKLERYYESFVVAEILAEPYGGERFPGYDQIDIGFPALENVFNRQLADWKTALENAKGVYVITDHRNGRKYVGSAYGGTGIWARWSCYASTCHGFNDELTRLIKAKGTKYARLNFRFSLLEYFPLKTDDDLILQRESHWKNILMSRGRFGYNRN